MSVDYTLHSLLALWSLVLGVACGFVYEFFRLLHRLHPCLLADPSGRSFLWIDLYSRHDAFVFQFILWENALLCIPRRSSWLYTMVFHVRKSFQTSMSSYFQHCFASRKISSSLFSYLRRNLSYFNPRRRRLRCKAFYQKEQ